MTLQSSCQLLSGYSWDDEDAKVICRSLGFSGGSAVDQSSDAWFGAGVGQILLDDVECNGNEWKIQSCDHRTWFQHDCGHNEDAGVICGEHPVLFLI